jgi:hypothetical protein
MTEEEAAALAAERGMTLGQYLRMGGAEAMLLARSPSTDHQEERLERLTNRTDEQIDDLNDKVARELTFNELVALAGERLERLEKSEEPSRVSIDEHRDLWLSRAALEDALTRYNSACYRRHGSWKRADPDRTLS